MHDARPITILSCLYRLFGKMIFKTVSKIWTRFFPAPISGGLPGRGVKEIAFAQKRFIEDSLQSGQTCGGFSLDLIKAFNTFGRFAVARILNHLGIPDVILGCMDFEPRQDGTLSNSEWLRWESNHLHNRGARGMFD